MEPKLAETVDMIGVKNLWDAFRWFDTSGDEEVSTSLPEATRKLLGHQVGPRDIGEISRVVDLSEVLSTLSSHWFLEGMQTCTATFGRQFAVSNKTKQAIFI